ncbi:MAG: hypothetical protein AAF570_03225 [Bacteroidota bacterium]
MRPKNSLAWIAILGCFLSQIFLNHAAAQSQAGGFTDQWANYGPGEFGSLSITFDTAGLRALERAPANGVHPRIYFGPSELPGLRSRLQNTLAGQEVMKQIHAYTTLLHFGYSNGGMYSHNANYAKDAFGNRRIDNAGAWDKHDRYYALAALDTTALNGANGAERYRLASIMALEAFECLIYTGQTDSTTGMAYDDRADMLARAMSFWAQLVVGNPSLTWQNYNDFGGVHMAFCYDLNYGQMSTAERDSVRMGLAAIVPAYPRYGAFTEPYSTASNWAGLNAFEILTNMAIEGETGFNATLFHDYMRAYRNFITYGWYASGTPLEGQGKNYQMNGVLVAMAKRGYSLLGHPHVRAYGSNYLPANVQPYGHAFVSEDVWGGSGWDGILGGYKFNALDIVGLKWAMPNDAGVDFAWRNYIEKWYRINSTGYVYQQITPVTSGYHNYLLAAAIFADDYTPGNWENQFAAAVPDLSFLSPERGKATLRSSHQEDALMLQFFCRQDLGGHTHGDRNNFILSGEGRTWIRYTYGSAFQETQYHSCILVDSLGIAIAPMDGRKARQPGKIVNFADTSRLAQVTGDAAYAYSWEWHWQSRPAGQDHSWLNTNGWTKVEETWNDFRYQPGTEAFHNVPFYDFAHWNDSSRLERMIKRPYNPLERYFRTAVLARTDAPFALIVDDIQKDDSSHQYLWLAQIANDLVLDTVILNHDTANFRCDVILGESAGSRKMLVRVLENTGYLGGAPARIDTLAHNINGNSPLTRLIIEADTVAPDFKVLLFPYEDGDALPQTDWNGAYDLLTVSFPTDTVKLVFDTLDGRTLVSEWVPPVMIAEDAAWTSGMEVFPNPAASRVRVRLGAPAEAGLRVRVHALDGREVAEMGLDAGEMDVELDCGDWVAGVYLIGVYRDGVRVAGEKLVKF